VSPPLRSGERLNATVNRTKCDHMQLEAGFLLNERYRIVRLHERGRSNLVYMARDEILGFDTAIKVNLTISEEHERQLKREAVLLASLRHPNLPRAVDCFTVEGRVFIVMDFIEGDTLQHILAQGLPSLAQALSWAETLCGVLSYLHSLHPPIIHRDVEPSNVIIQKDGTPILVDLGSAKVGEGAARPMMTPRHSSYGRYATTTRLSDQYSLAAILYTLLTGSVPEDSLNRFRDGAQLTPIRVRNPHVPRDLETVITRALSLDPNDRFKDIDSFRKALRVGRK